VTIEDLKTKTIDKMEKLHDNFQYSIVNIQFFSMLLAVAMEES